MRLNGSKRDCGHRAAQHQCGLHRIPFKNSKISKSAVDCKGKHWIEPDG